MMRSWVFVYAVLSATPAADDIGPIRYMVEAVVLNTDDQQETIDVGTFDTVAQARLVRLQIHVRGACRPADGLIEECFPQGRVLKTSISEVYR